MMLSIGNGYSLVFPDRKMRQSDRKRILVSLESPLVSAKVLRVVLRGWARTTRVRARSRVSGRVGSAGYAIDRIASSISSEAFSGRKASTRRHLLLKTLSRTMVSHFAMRFVFSVSRPGVNLPMSPSTGLTVMCVAFRLRRRDSRTNRSVAISRCSVKPPTMWTITSACFRASSCHPTKSFPTMSSMSPPSQSRSVTCGFLRRYPSPK
mmetsp:Transcript_17142/g.39582  ORF Transcript_17142/g.39582 Transcript_17142/m.39582 type:complete len:208 (-) Transcript_17142:223-846(-)